MGESTSVATASFENGLLKLGHPEPLSNLLDEENNLLEQQMQETHQFCQETLGVKRAVPSLKLSYCIFYIG